jgi:hypothetical protein
VRTQPPTPTKKPAGQKPAAERNFFSTPTPAMPAQIKVTKNATIAKWIAPNRPPLASTLTTALSKKKAAKWNDSALLAELRDTQTAWARYRDLQCEAETTPYDGGTVTISIKAGCEREKAEARLKELQDTYARYLRSN